MNEQMSGLMVDWNKQQGQLKKFAELDLEFSYKFGGKQMEEKKAQIIDALAFWRFVKELSLLHWEARRFFLAYFAINSNPLIRIVAMVECLPTSVWRKILWKHNIDFMSFESFLRRLDKKQFEVIKRNYEDLFEAEEVPRIFSRFERFLRGITVEKLWEEDFNSEKRYSQKAAMSFNLLNLDFGFNAYPKGVKDDTKVEELSPLKFLSVKNHADDFVVNKEGGKYWWLYRKARSNYVWRPNREVKIKTHICPGFWYTLLLHFVFWILSPLASAAFAGIAAHGFSSANWWLTGSIGIIGLITPLWLTLAGLKLLFTAIAKAGIALINSALTKQAAKSFDRWIKRNENAIIICSVGSLLVILATITSMIMFWLLSPSLGAVGAIATITMILVYLGYGAFHREYKFTAFKDFPLYLKMPIIFVVFCLVYKFLLLYQATIIFGIFTFVFFLKWLVAVGIHIIKIAFLLSLSDVKYLWQIITAFGFQRFATILAIISIPITIIATLHYLPEEKQRKFYNIMGRGLWYGLGAYFLMAISISAYWLVAYGGVLGIIFVILFTGYGAVAWYIFFYSSPYVKKSQWIAEYISSFRKSGIDFRSILKNKWLLSLEKYEAAETAYSFYSLLKWLFDADYGYCTKAFNLIMPFISADLLQKLVDHRQILRESGDYDLRLTALNIFVSQDTDIKSAVKLAKKEMAEQKKLETTRIKNINEFRENLIILTETAGKILYVVFFIPIQFWKLGAMILRGVWFAIKKLWEYLVTLRRLWELFNEGCPYITEQKVLKFK